MYYTHEYSDKKFEDYDECKDDLIINLDICDYTEHISAKEILRNFFRRKSNTEFCDWLENKTFDITEEIAEELITEHEEEEEAQNL